MSKNKMIVDFHVIQTVPPSNINRDDTGSPKTAIYGGVQRARVSSQAWKKAIRKMFREHFDESELGIRTLQIVQVIAAELSKLNSEIPEDEAVTLIHDALKNIGKKGLTMESKKDKENETAALFFISVTQARNIAKLIIDKYEASEKISKKDMERLLTMGHSVDVALFGRMVADDPSLNADASAQVAHSISVHKVDNEYDFYTAVDDVKENDKNATDDGAAMIGTVEFNSSTLYRYATVFVDLLHEELAGDAEITAKAVAEFARGFITSMPTGKQNAFANHTPAHVALVTIREDQPINFVGAFEKPIPFSNNGIASFAVQRLAQYADDVYNSFATRPAKSYIVELGDIAEGFDSQDKRVNLDELLTEIRAEVKSRYASDGE
jgi:CRISPR system Cascade subunit CasC